MFAAPPSRRPRGYLLAAGAVLVLLVGVWFGGHPSWLPGPLRSAFTSQSSNDRLVNDVVGLLKSDYYRKLDTTKLLNTGLAQAVASIGDPYSHYYAPGDYKQFEAQTNPQLSGIGVDIINTKKGLIVDQVFAGSPAAKAGLRHGDLITRADSTSLANRTSQFSSGLIRGTAGTSVLLTIVRDGHTLTRRVTRADVTVPVASGRMLNYRGAKIGDVELSSFAEHSGAEVKSQVAQLRAKGARAIILDLRGNGGGLLVEGVNVASVFIPSGTIVSTAGRAQPRQVYTAKGGAIPTSVPVVVLVDHDTASAAEIVTAALQDQHRATVVGTHTYGKGVFQEIQPLFNGGALDFTVGEFFTPSGRNLGGGGVKRGAGVSPDVYAYTNFAKPHAKDIALQTAERVVAGKLK